MPKIKFQVYDSPAGYPQWEGTFDVPNIYDEVRNGNQVSNITITNDNYQFVPTSFQMYPEGGTFVMGGANYVTWRTQDIGSAQFPNTGKSIDLWSSSLYLDIDSGMTWNQLGSYDLNPNKYSLVYDYDNLYAPYLTQGGKIDFAISGDN